MIDFKGKLALAPMAGVGDSPFRRICRRLGADLVWSEMVSAEGLARGQGGKSHTLLRFLPEERPLGLQLFGADPESMERAARLAARLGPDFIDLNFGCPVPKVVRRKGGASLMREPELVGRIARAAVAGAGGLPVTAKLRSGWDSGSLNYLEVAGRLWEAGVSAVALHPRTRTQLFSGRSDWSQIARLKAQSPGPVIGSGDVLTPADALEMFAVTGCDTVMVARAAMGNPWIFARARALLAGKPDPGEPSLEERIAVALEHAALVVEQRGELSGVLVMRKHLAAYTRGLPEATGLRRELFACRTLAEVVGVFDRYREG